MIRVIIESPFGSRTDGSRASLVEVQRNILYLNRCIRDSLDHDEAPFASHRMYTSAYDDALPEQRQRGMEAGWAWAGVANLCAVYLDYGMTPGMLSGIERFRSKLPGGLDVNLQIVHRHIGQNPSDLEGK